MRGGSSFSALREGRFRFLFGANAVSVLGDNVVPVALAFAVLDLTGSAADLGLVLMARLAPMAFLSLAGGVWADRLSRRNLMVTANLARFLSQGVLGFLLVAGVARLWELAVLQAAHGAASAFYRPASTGLLPELVSRERLQEANALLFMTLSVSTVAGPAIAGVLVATVGSGWAILVDSASFAVASLLLVRLGPLGRLQQVERASFLRELADGYAEVRARTWVWVSILHFSLFQLVFLSTFPVLGPLVALRSLGGPSAWALIAASFGVGTVVGGLLALKTHPRRPLFACYVLIIGTVPSLFLLGVAAPVGAIAAAMAVAGVAMSFGTTVWETILQEQIPREALSRVAAYDWVGSLVLRPAGLAVVGPIAAAITVRSTFVGAASLLLAGTLVVLTVPSIRALTRPVAERTPAPGLEPAGVA
jgi:predicted MFS family arabinose efflux permease